MSSIGAMGTSGACAFLTFFCSDKAEAPGAIRANQECTQEFIALNRNFRNP